MVLVLVSPNIIALLIKEFQESHVMLVILAMAGVRQDLPTKTEIGTSQTLK
jgi:hypothetical protein